MLSVGRRRLLATVIIFPVLAVMFLTISDSSVAEHDDGSGALSDEQRQMSEQNDRGPSYLSLTVMAVVVMGAVMTLIRRRRLAST